MNIITNKDVFSDENQAKIPKKIERRRPPMRKPNSTPSAPAAPTATPVAENPAVSAETPSEATSAPKTVFYQASRASQQARPLNNAPRPHTPAPAAPGAAINPADLAANVAKQSGYVRPHYPSNQRPDRPDQRGGRFTTAHRRPGRGQLPQDSAGVFMTPNGQQSLSSNTPVRPMPAPTGEKLKIIPLGGLEEIGKNMTVFEYGNDILIVDMGFMFPDSDMPGVDYIIPDVTYLQDKKANIRGAIITHGHLDHTGAIPYLVEKLGFPTLYGTAITMGMAKGRLAEFGLDAKNKTVAIDPEKDVLQLGVFRVRPFRLIHSIPGAIGLEIETPNGRIAYCTDWKFDYTPSDGKPIDFRTLAAVGSRGVDLLFSDSTNVDRPGHSISEKVVQESLAAAISEAKGRVIIAMFSSDLNRIQQTLNGASKDGRKVLILGRSMQQNVEMAVNLKVLVVPPNTLISEREANRFDGDSLLVLSTGAQGEDRSALSRMASGEHRIIKIRKGDTVIISASPIPGNERSVSGVMDMLYKAGAQVIYNKILDVHTSGHAYQEDLKLMLALMKPRFFVPLHGERSRLVLHGKLAQEVGVKPEDVIIGDNGLILEMDSTGRVYPTDNHVPAGYVMVDGLGIGDVGNIVLRDRQAMAQEGIFVVINVFDTKEKKFLTSPDIISRGFIYMRENEQFVNDVRNEIKRFLAHSVSDKKSIDINSIKNELRDMISKMLHEKTERQPMVIPVIIEV